MHVDANSVSWTSDNGDRMKDILPDSRARGGRGAVLGKWGVYWVPVYCASCGVFYGRVPEETCTFAFWQCDDCFKKYGLIAGTMVEPETVFWHKVAQEMDEKYGRELTPEELQSIVDADSSPLASLLKEGTINLKGV